MKDFGQRPGKTLALFISVRSFIFNLYLSSLSVLVSSAAVSALDSSRRDRGKLSHLLTPVGLFDSQFL